MTLPVEVGTRPSPANDDGVTAGEVDLDLGVTIDADAKILLVFAASQQGDRTVDTVTIDFDGDVALTEVVTAQYTTSGNGNYVSMWRITSTHANWDTGAFTLTATPSGYTTTVTLMCVQYDNVDPDDPIASSGGATWNGTTSNPVTMALTADADQLVPSFGAWYNSDPSGGQSGDDLDYQDNGSVSQSCESQDQAGAGGSTTLSFTHGGNIEWAIVGVVLKDVAAAGSNPKGPLTHPLYGPLRGPIS